LAITTRESIQQAEFAIEDRVNRPAIDRPAPRIRDVERPANLGGTSVRHIEEPLGIATATATALGEIMRNAARGSFHLIRSIGTVLAQLSNDRTKRSDQIECDCICDQHVLLESLGFTKKERPPADDLRGWATPVATDPRQDP